MIRVGITGQSGFIGTHLYNRLGLYPERFARVPFEDAFFDRTEQLRTFVAQCDVVVHLAARNREPDDQALYDTNLSLTTRLIEAMNAERVTPRVLFSSSIQERNENRYGISKHDSRKLLERWASRTGASLCSFLIPNVFGPFALPFYNSFIATFSRQLIVGEQPQVIEDREVPLIDVGSLCTLILDRLENDSLGQGITSGEIAPDFRMKVSAVRKKLTEFRDIYVNGGNIPPFSDGNELNLFHAFQSQIELKSHFPVPLKLFRDERGVFAETVRSGSGGQVSYATTAPGAVRGNHFHTRKIERFTVIKGKALLRIRRVGASGTITMEIDGDRSPAWVDIPVWHTHNITNIGETELVVQFWINEWYDPNDTDTYFETV